MSNKISYEEVHKLFDYDPETGVFINKVARQGSRKGEIAGGLDISTGYWVIGVNYKSYRAHQLAWLYVYGYFPEYDLDHKDKIRHHNWIDNLREVTRSCNVKNSKIFCTNTSGITGIYWCKKIKKWQVDIYDKNHKRIRMGYFASKLEAAKVRYAAEIKHDYPDCQTQSSALAYINSAQESEEL